jgi:predicted GNAT family acetyltransferase
LAGVSLPKIDEYSGLEFGEQPIAGLICDGEIVAAAGYEIWGGEIAHIGVVTHPRHRGNGLGRTVVSAIAMHGLEKGLLLQYRTLYSNVPSMRIAKSLAFEEYGATIYVRGRVI